MAAYLAMAAAPLILPALMLAVSGIACVVDVRHRLIPDWCCAALALLAGGQALATGTLFSALIAGLICLALGVLAALTGLWGWGDAKLIGAAGSAVGVTGLLPLLMGTALVGGLLAAILILLRQPVRAGLISLPAGAPRWLRAEQTRLRRAPTIPYALAITAGLALALASGA